MKLRIARWGDSLAVRLPAELVRALRLKAGDEVETEISAAGEIKLRPSHFDKAAFLARLEELHARIPLQSESAGDLVRKMRGRD